jgi:hypothetical protein
MITTAELFKTKKFPNWFADNPIFKKVDKIKKVFPSIGLPNSEEEIQVDNIAPAKTAAKQLVAAIGGSISHRIETLEKYVAKKPEMSEARKAQSDKCLLMLKGILALMNNKPAFIGNVNGRFTLKMPSDIVVNGEPVFRETQSLFRVYNRLNEYLSNGHFSKMVKLEDMYQFKTFSTENVPNNKFKIVFSADGADGLWDIATMSMRGVKSCQSWDDGAYKHCTIGSVIDPYVGIIYLTSGAKFSDHGSRMMKRCIVRFVIDSNTNKPYLLLDNMYPNFDDNVFGQFAKFLKSKTGDKFDVKYAPNTKNINQTYLPTNEVRKLLKQTNRDGEKADNLSDLDSLASYQDYKINDKEANKNDKQGILYEKNAKKKTQRFVNDFRKAVKIAIDSLEDGDIPESLKPIIGKLKGTDKKNFNYSHILPEISQTIANSFVKSVDKACFTSSDLLVRRIFCSYFNNKNAIINEVKNKIAKEINGRLRPKGKDKIGADKFVALMKLLSPKIDIVMKEKLRKLLLKDKLESELPLP